MSAPRSADPVTVTPVDRLMFTLLAPVLLAWYGWCRLRGRMEDAIPLLHALGCALRGPSKGSLGVIFHEEGHCYRADVPGSLMDNDRGRSTLTILENGQPLGPSHAQHDDIRTLGRGRFDHWQGYVWFSSSDNTDPRTNGRNYTFEEDWT